MDPVRRRPTRGGDADQRPRRFSQAIHELCFDERLLHDATLASDHMRVCDDRLDGPMAFVKNANAANGQLLVLAGSHRYTKHWYSWGSETDLPVVALETEPGDLTPHYGDTMHTTPPPTSDDAGRRALSITFSEPHTFEWVPSGCHDNDVLFRPDAEGRIGSRATTWKASHDN